VTAIGLSLNADLINGDMPTLERHIGYVADAGCDYVELILHGLDVVIAGKLNRPRVDAVIRILDRFQLRRTLHLPYELNLLSADRHAAYYACFAAGLEFAATAGCEVVTYHSSFMELDPRSQRSGFYRKFGGNPDDRYGRLLEFDLDALGSLAESAGEHVRIGVENTAWHDPAIMRGYGRTPRSVAAHIARLRTPRVGVTMDIGHLYMASCADGLDFTTELTHSLPSLAHMHIHDNFGDSTRADGFMAALPYGFGDLHLPVGWGTIPWDTVLTGLASYEGIWMMEIEFRFYPHFPELVASMRARVRACAPRTCTTSRCSASASPGRRSL
jgi:sugar phosphate isomerase/epimerase